MKIVSCLLLFTFVSLAGFAQRDSITVKNPQNIKPIGQKPPLDPKLLKPKSNGSTPAPAPDPGPEPASIYGYVTWSDPATGKSHIPKGQDTRTTNWKYCIGYPTFKLTFQNKTTGATMDLWINSGGTFQMLIDSTGTPCSAHLDAAGNETYTWADSSSRSRTGTYTFLPTTPAAYKYRFNFVHDMSFTGNPLRMDSPRPSGSSVLPYDVVPQGIRYNPAIWHFQDIIADWVMPPLTIPVSELPDGRPVWRKLDRPVADLPDRF